jgi:hypothetical protein
MGPSITFPERPDVALELPPPPPPPQPAKQITVADKTKNALRILLSSFGDNYFHGKSNLNGNCNGLN